MVEDILSFLGRTKGLIYDLSKDSMLITQMLDKRLLSVNFNELFEVLHRTDADERDFLQINLRDGRKILLTNTLIGFKPFELSGLDMSKIPRVVTTPDLLNVLEAIEETLSSENISDGEFETLKKVFYSILQGGELIGFNLKSEKNWLERLAASNFRAAA
jgi:hypothetical protein